MRDGPAAVRALLVGMGLTELLLVSLTDRAPGRRRFARRA
jgi:alpha-D-ribose 1-methylphosphonate 5-triphosphate diphosphatase PhnM